MDVEAPLSPSPSTRSAFSSTAPLAAFRNVVESRRSVRLFSAAPVPAEVMQASFDMALLAPSASNLQPWEFHWVRSAERKERMRELCLRQPAAMSAAEIVVCVGRRNWQERRQWMIEILEEKQLTLPPPFDVYYQKFVPVSYTLGILNIVGYLKRAFFAGMRLFRPFPRVPSNAADMRLWAVKSTALASAQFMLGLRAHGYDSCALDGYDPVRIAKLLGLPKDAVIAMVICVGKRAEDDAKYGPRLRFPRDTHVKIS